LVPTLETERLLMRGWREEDLEPYSALMADADVQRYLEGRPYDRFESWRSMALHVGHWVLRGHGFWVVELRDTGEFVGRVGLWRPEGWPGLEVGWTLAREHWGRGYATEAGGAALRHAFGSMGAERVLSVIHPENEASKRVAERLGLRFDRRMELMGQQVCIYATAHPPSP
jgi:RimJ/RimL family protein N-acetyltransferase